jgi:hypothetical protein
VGEGTLRAAVEWLAGATPSERSRAGSRFEQPASVNNAKIAFQVREATPRSIAD